MAHCEQYFHVGVCSINITEILRKKWFPRILQSKLFMTTQTVKKAHLFESIEYNEKCI